MDTLTLYPFKFKNKMIATERKDLSKASNATSFARRQKPLLGTASGNAGKIQSGTVTGDAKRNFFNEEEDEDQEGFSWDNTEKD